MRKILLSEQAIYCGDVKMPKDWEIDRNHLSGYILQSNIRDSEFLISRTWDKLNTYIREHIRIKNNLIIENKDSWANAYVPNPSSPGGVIGTPNDNPSQKPASPPSFIDMKGFGGATGGGPSAIDSDGLPITPQSTAEEISQSTKTHPRGESGWTTSQKLDSRTTVDANGNA